MRHSVLRKLLIASATTLLSLSVMSTPALAQKPRPKPPAGQGAAKKPPAKPNGAGDTEAVMPSSSTSRRRRLPGARRRPRRRAGLRPSRGR